MSLINFRINGSFHVSRVSTELERIGFGKTPTRGSSFACAIGRKPTFLVLSLRLSFQPEKQTSFHDSPGTPKVAWEVTLWGL